MNEGTLIEKGSFRDPSGFVFYDQGRVFRKLDVESFRLFQELEEKGIIRELQENHRIISSRSISSNDPIHERLRKISCESEYFLEHQKVPFVSYPYEWTFSMLVEAAKLHLELQAFLVKRGYSLKDATAYNIQFLCSKPVFIDIPSIETSVRRDVWIAYGQFCQMFLFPIFLKKYRNIDLKGIFLSNIDGVTVTYLFHALGTAAACFTPSLFLDVFLQYHLHRIAAKKVTQLKRTISQRQNDPSVQLMNLERLLRKLDGLSSSYKKTTPWLDYTSTHTYSDKAENEKISYVKNFLDSHPVKSVLDIGCNTGQYSFLAAQTGADVIAIDSDHDCIDLLYQRLKRRPANILPLWVDIVNPSPAIGFNNKERKSFLDRVHVECVFALALLHHLLIASRIPLMEIRDLFYRLTDSLLVIEFISPRDQMFQRLLALRKDIYGEIDLDKFISIFSQKFELIHRQPVADTDRILFTMKKKT